MAKYATPLFIPLMGLCLIPHLGSLCRASDLDEFKVKPEQVFEFARKPSVARHGDNIAISFETKGLCDATVAIEDAAGKIVRHLASGVLGPNAPEPFQKNSKKQTVVWDGKDDQREYIADKDSHSIRVSLGLKPQLERTLYWSPKKRLAPTGRGPFVCAAPDGVYVLDSGFEDHLRLFNHQGAYVRTVYPFPHGKLKETKGLKWHDFPHGFRLPLKTASWQQTLLTSGASANGGASAATAMALLPAKGQQQAGRIALVENCLNRLATDGTTGGLPLEGSPTAIIYKDRNGKEHGVSPRSAAFSPDGKWLYLTGYTFNKYEWYPAVMRVPVEENGKPELFKGTLELKKSGSGENEFKVPTGVACDRAGRVYVADNMNNRIQVFTPDGMLFKSIKIYAPTHLEINPTNGELWVFSWLVHNRYLKDRITPTLTVLGSVNDPKKKASYPLSLEGHIDKPSMWLGKSGNLEFYRPAVDFWTRPPTVWVVSGGTTGVKGHDAWNKWGRGLRLYQPEKKKLVLKQDFAEAAQKAVVRVRPPTGNNQELLVNPIDGKLYIGEGDTGCLSKDFSHLIQVDPETGKIKKVPLPFGTQDADFDINGLIYLRTTTFVARYDPTTWREVPWDYGEERDGKFMGVLPVPSTSPVCYHQGGLSVSPTGHLVVACSYRFAGDNLATQKWNNARINPDAGAKKYAPKMWPGRYLGSTTAFAHVWDKHGQIVHEDSVPGMPQVDGIGIDKDDNIYIMATPPRVLDGKPFFNKVSSTVMKFKPKKSRFLSGSKRCRVVLEPGIQPKRPRDVGGYWVNPEWFYGSVGFAGFNKGGTGCACKWTRMSLDYFGRSFAPETYQYRVAVLDTNGNLILRVGQFGNVDDGKALVAEGGPPHPRSIGGDEVALFHPRFTASHTDRRLFIADYGNACIRSVKLGYHQEARVALKEIPDKAR